MTFQNLSLLSYRHFAGDISLQTLEKRFILLRITFTPIKQTLFAVIRTDTGIIRTLFDFPERQTKVRAWFGSVFRIILPVLGHILPVSGLFFPYLVSYFVIIPSLFVQYFVTFSIIEYFRLDFCILSCIFISSFYFHCLAALTTSILRLRSNKRRFG